MWPFKILFLLFFVNFSLCDDCGWAKVGAGLSIGANYSDPGQWPWLASILFGERYWCGASIISKKFLLGAAHCIQPKRLTQLPQENFSALLGHYDLNDKNDREAIKVKFLNIYLHPDWNASAKSYDGDIALYWMADEIKFTDFIQPICLPTANAKIFDVEGVVAGYGISETAEVHENRPKYVKIKSVSDQLICLYKTPDLAGIGSLQMFCAGEQGKIPCRGDSGGPFMVKNDRKWTINGIVSAAASTECKDNDFVLFTQVPKFLEWIKEIMEGRGLQLECKKHPWQDDKTTCYTKSLNILEPNLRVTSISPDENLNFNEIEKIWIGDDKVHYLPDFSLANKKFPNLKELVIADCGLKELDRSKLALLPQLTELHVDFNKIQELAEDSFDGLINLEKLSIGSNQVQILPQKLLWKLPKLKNFIARYNQIEKIPVRFFEMNKNIELIRMENNEIRELPEDSFDGLINLEKLSIGVNQVKILPQKLLWKLPKLKEFNAWNNQIEAIPARFFEMNKNIEKISMSNNKIKELPENIFDALINLKYLSISDNTVKILPNKLLWKLPKLKEFRASSNQIEAIPARFFDINKNIEKIWFDDNKISRIEIDLSSLPKLKEFELNKNQCISKWFREDGNWGALTDKDEFQRFIDSNCH